jgi:hypothetical protein
MGLNDKTISSALSSEIDIPAYRRAQAIISCIRMTLIKCRRGVATNDFTDAAGRPRSKEKFVRPANKWGLKVEGLVGVTYVGHRMPMLYLAVEVSARDRPMRYPVFEYGKVDDADVREEIMLADDPIGVAKLMNVPADMIDYWRSNPC